MSLPKAPPLAPVVPHDEPGLSLTIANLAPRAPGADGGAFAPDVRTARMLAIEVPAGESPSAFTAPGPFRATFEGDINLRLREFMIFSAQGAGTLTLHVNNKPVLHLSGQPFPADASKPIRLNKGKNHVVAVYESPAKGDASLRIFWNDRNSSPEPLPPMVLTHAADDAALRQGLRVREGRFLIGEFRCTRCHLADGIVGSNDRQAMPELKMDAPSLKDVGARLNGDWIAAWINDPRSLWPGAHMPRLFAKPNGTDVSTQAKDIAAYVSTLGAAPADVTITDAKRAAGGRLFADLNCIACHISPERAGSAQPSADAGRVSLAYVKAKFKPAALKQFLLAPSAHFAWNPMPDFRLTDDEAQSLCAYLLSSPGKSLPHVTGNARAGETLLHSAGCLNCHNLGEKQTSIDKTRLPPALARIPAEGWVRGCMASNAASRRDAPDFALTSQQRDAILAFAATDRSSLWHDSPAEFTARQMTALRCTACHARDGHESLLAASLDAENQSLHARFPAPRQDAAEGLSPDQRAPMLTWTGGKLRPEWMAQFIGGHVPYKPRYYLLARMPGFASRADLLARGLAEQHGGATAVPEYAAPDPKLAAIGRNLVGKTPNASFGCVQCHAIGGQRPLAPFEAPAINFMYVTARLRQDYYYRWVHNPPAIDPETKMPRFDDADGKTGIPVFDNDAKKQFEAIWNYLLAGKKIQPPEQ